MDDDIDPALIAVLEQLWRAHQDASGRSWSLAKLAKQSDLAMSTLRRLLTGLSDAGLVNVALADTGAGTACLTDDGVTFCREVFAQCQSRR